MRNSLCAALIDRSARSQFVFITGDLGYQALEPLRDVMGERFINAGVAEQNMISVAAGLAKQGFEPWCYSIAPFVYARPFEQIRNDAGLTGLPVRLIGNGGGYGYGVMGATHHAIEDCGVMLSVQNMRVFVPAFGDDVAAAIDRINAVDNGPSYLRLGRCEKPAGFSLPPYAPWRKLTSGGGATAVFVGPLAGGAVKLALEVEIERRPNIWIVSELPISREAIPAEFLADLESSHRLMTVEEHIRQGSAGASLAALLMEMGVACAKFQMKCANGYAGGRYGSQGYHRISSGIDAESVIRGLINL
jgi:transketolase